VNNCFVTCPPLLFPSLFNLLLSPVIFPTEKVSKGLFFKLPIVGLIPFPHSTRDLSTPLPVDFLEWVFFPGTNLPPLSLFYQPEWSFSILLEDTFKHQFVAPVFSSGGPLPTQLVIKHPPPFQRNTRVFPVSLASICNLTILPSPVPFP